MRPNAVLKCFEGPASIVSPDVNPPFSVPENAIFIAGICVGVLVLSFKYFDSDRTFTLPSLKEEFFRSLLISPVAIYFSYSILSL